jgi:lipoyl(octanoyl) transferase
VLFENLATLVDPTPHAAAINMAFDEVLLLASSEPVLRLYQWQRPAVSLGYFIRHSTVPADGREIVRRMTGGGVVEHGEDLTYSLIIPASHPLAEAPPRHSYRVIHKAIAAWLSRLGISATLAPAPHVGPAQVCFQSAAESDILLAGKKIAGAAQRRTRAGLLHQGSILCPLLAKAEHAQLPAAFSESARTEAVQEKHLAAAGELAAQKYALDAWTRRV